MPARSNQRVWVLQDTLAGRRAASLLCLTTRAPMCYYKNTIKFLEGSDDDKGRQTRLLGEHQRKL